MSKLIQQNPNSIYNKYFSAGCFFSFKSVDIEIGLKMFLVSVGSIIAKINYNALENML